MSENYQYQTGGDQQQYYQQQGQGQPYDASAAAPSSYNQQSGGNYSDPNAAAYYYQQGQGNDNNNNNGAPSSSSSYYQGGDAYQQQQQPQQQQGYEGGYNNSSNNGGRGNFDNAYPGQQQASDSRGGAGGGSSNRFDDRYDRHDRHSNSRGGGGGDRFDSRSRRSPRRDRDRSPGRYESRDRDRHGDRDSRDRYDRDRSRSPPPRDRPKRKSNFDTGPSGEPMGASAIRYNANSGNNQNQHAAALLLQSQLAQQAAAAAAAVGGVNPLAQAQLAIQQLQANQQGVNPNHAQLTRKARRLYVGNLPQNLKNIEQLLGEFFATAMSTAGLNIAPGNSVLSVWLNPEGKFAFIEFRTVEETTTAMSLQGIEFHGRQLKVSRPNDYSEPPAEFNRLIVPTPTQSGVRIDYALPAASAGFFGSAAAAPEESKVPIISRVVMFSNMIDPNAMQNEEEYNEVLEDTTDECAKYGTLRTLRIPRLSDPEPLNSYADRCFAAYLSSEDAIRAQLSLNGRCFDNQPVIASFFKEDEFDRLFSLPPLPPEIRGQKLLTNLPQGAGLD